MLSDQERQRRESQIIALRSQGFSNNEVVEKTGLPYCVVINTVHQLIKKGKVKKQKKGNFTVSEQEHIRREEGIIRLRNKGLDNKAIAKKLGLTSGIVIVIASQLIREKRLVPHRQHFTKEQRQSYKKRVVLLRNLGLANGKIAALLGVSVRKVDLYAHELIKENLLDSRTSATWRDLESGRMQTIIKMVKKGKTLREIGEAIGVSRQRVEQLVSKTSEEFGEEIFEP